MASEIQDLSTTTGFGAATDPVFPWQSDSDITSFGKATPAQIVSEGGGAGADTYTFTEVSEPASPSANDIIMFAVDDNGITVLETKDPNGVVTRISEDLFIVARNMTGSAIAKGAAVYINGSNGNRPTIALARANAESTLPSIGAAAAEIANNDFGIIINTGTITGIDTSAFTEGNKLYISSTTAGAYTATRPSHPNFAQSVGTVENSHATLGTILFKVTSFFGGLETGTIQNSFSVGDGTSGNKDLVFANGQGGTLRANPTSARTWTLPDTTGTLVTNIVAPTTLTNTTHDVTDDENGEVLLLTNVSGCTVTLANNSTPGVSALLVPDTAAGDIDIVAEAGGTLQSTEGTEVTITADGVASVYCISNSGGNNALWLVSGTIGATA